VKEQVMSLRSRLGATTALVSLIMVSGATGSPVLSAHAKAGSTATSRGKNGGIAFRRWLDSSQSTGVPFVNLRRAGSKWSL